MMVPFDIRTVARTMGGTVSGEEALVPGPRHSPKDRSLSIRVGPQFQDGFITHSFAGDDPLVCRDYVRQKLGLPPWQPKKPAHNGNWNDKRTVVKPPTKTETDTGRLPESAIPAWMEPGSDGKPQFCHWGNEGPQKSDNELRRHVYHGGDGVAVRIKIKNGTWSTFTDWYRVRNTAGVIGWQAKKPNDYQDIPYIGLTNPFDPELASDEIFWPEGEKDCETLGNKNIPAFTFGGCGDGLPEAAATYLSGRRIIILADNDDPGQKHAEKKAALARQAGAAAIKVLHFPELPDHGDVSDFFAAGGTAAELMQRADAAPEWQPATCRRLRGAHGRHRAMTEKNDINEALRNGGQREVLARHDKACKFDPKQTNASHSAENDDQVIAGLAQLPDITY